MSGICNFMAPPPRNIHERSIHERALHRALCAIHIRRLRRDSIGPQGGGAYPSGIGAAAAATPSLPTLSLNVVNLFLQRHRWQQAIPRRFSIRWHSGREFQKRHLRCPFRGRRLHRQRRRYRLLQRRRRLPALLVSGWEGATIATPR